MIPVPTNKTNDLHSNQTELQVPDQVQELNNLLMQLNSSKLVNLLDFKNDLLFRLRASTGRDDLIELLKALQQEQLSTPVQEVIEDLIHEITQLLDQLENETYEQINELCTMLGKIYSIKIHKNDPLIKNHLNL